MATIQNVLLEAFSQEHGWLARQPGMTPWKAGCDRLHARLDAWFTGYAADICEQPPGASQAGRDMHLFRLWRCWSFHWRDQAAAGEPVDGQGVAESLQAKLHPRTGNALRGDPFYDVVLVEAVLQGDNRAIRTFDREYSAKAQLWARQVNAAIASDLGWWQDLESRLVGTGRRDGSLTSFEGRSPLESWMEQTVKRELWRQVARQRRKREVLEDLQSSAVETSPANFGDDAATRECFELLAGVLREALDDSTTNEKLAVQLRLGQGLSVDDVAKVLQVHKGNVTRTTQRFMARVQGILERPGAAGQAGSDSYQPCLEQVFGAGSRGAIGSFLQRVVADLDEAESSS